jgi:hypothetical protein
MPRELAFVNNVIDLLLTDADDGSRPEELHHAPHTTLVSVENRCRLQWFRRLASAAAAK